MSPVQESIAPLSDAADRKADEKSIMNSDASARNPEPTNLVGQAAETAEFGGAAANPASTQPIAASLYVGDLQPFVAEKDLYEFFRQIGEVASVRVCRDSITRRSLCYAYVNFANYADGEKALATLNYRPLAGKPCRLMWSQRDPSLRKSGDGNLYIKNLDPAISSKVLDEVFSVFGPILSVETQTVPDGSSKCGYVHFQFVKDSEEAIKKFNGIYFNDRKISVVRHVPKKLRENQMATLRQNFTNVFVKNLDDSVTQEDLMGLFAPFGKISSAIVQKKTDDVSLCFGFVNFENHECAMEAIEALNDTEFHGKRILVCRAQKKREREELLRKEFEARRQERFLKSRGNNLYVRNIDDDVTDEKLHNEFAAYGTIKSCKVMVDEKNNSRGFGFVCFSTPEEASKAMNELNGRMVFKKPLFVTIAQPREQRRAHLQATFERNNSQNNVMQAVPPHIMPGAPQMYPASAPMYFAPVHQGRAPTYYPGSQQVPLRPRWNAQGGAQPPAHMYPMNMPYPAPNMMQQRAQRPPRQHGNYQNVVPINQGGARGQQYRGQPRNARVDPNAIPAPATFRYQYGNQQDEDHENKKPAKNDDGTMHPTGVSVAVFESSEPHEKRSLLGDALHKAISSFDSAIAGKATGVILEMGQDEIINFLKNKEELFAKVTEISALLKNRNVDKRN